MDLFYPPVLWEKASEENLQNRQCEIPHQGVGKLFVSIFLVRKFFTYVVGKYLIVNLILKKIGGEPFHGLGEGQGPHSIPPKRR